MKAGEVWICNTLINIVTGQRGGQIMFHEFKNGDKVIIKSLYHVMEDMFVLIFPIDGEEGISLHSDLFLECFAKDYNASRG